MKRFAMLALAAVVTVVPASATHHMTISGYIDVGYWDREDDRGDAMNAGSSFISYAGGSVNAGNQGLGMAAMGQGQNSLNEVNLDIKAELTDNLMAMVSLDSVRGGALTPDVGYIEWSNPGSFDLNVRGGLVPSSVGIEQRWAESNQTKFNNLSLMSPWTVGSVEGVQAYGTWSPVNWQVAIANTDQIGDAVSVGALIPGAAGAGSLAATAANTLVPNNNGPALASQGNNSFAVQGRLGVLPIEGLELGVSASTSEYAASTGAAGSSDVDRTLWGLDLQYRYGPFTVLGEYMNAEEENQGAGGVGKVSDDEVDVWYVQGTYDFTDQITFGARYSDAEIEAGSLAGRFQHLAYNQISLLGAYDLAENVIVKIQYDINDEDVARDNIGGQNIVASSGDCDNDMFSTSVVASF